MPATALIDHFNGATSRLQLATNLGRDVLDHGGAVADTLHRSAVARRLLDDLELSVQAIPDDAWADIEQAGDLASMFTGDLARRASLARTFGALGHLGVLRGLCRRALPQIHKSVDEIVVSRGTPLPYAVRPINQLFDDTTPFHKTLDRNHPLNGLAHHLFSDPSGGRVPVVLDLRHATRLDEIGWGGAGHLPRVGTLHPRLGDAEIEIGEEQDGWFFDVRPKTFDSNHTLRCLQRLHGDAEVAVLPELSLRESDALEKILEEHHATCPPLVVAGSAHRRESSADDEVRANESRVYLDGKLVLRHRKIHAFATKELAGRRREKEMVEGITGERKTITLLGGRSTRLAVVICADLNDRWIPAMLEDLGVNLLVTPVLTVSPGAFTGAIARLASSCQGAAVIVNGTLDPESGADDPAPPLLIMVAVPRPGPRDQVDEHGAPETEGPVLGIVDLNEPAGSAVRWTPEP